MIKPSSGVKNFPLTSLPPYCAREY
jgi:hypothetical protein